MTIPKDLAEKRDKYAQELVRAGFQEGVLAALSSEQVLALVEALRDIESNFDHDEDSHKYNTTCRCCLSSEALDKWSSRCDSKGTKE